MKKHNSRRFLVFNEMHDNTIQISQTFVTIRRQNADGKGYEEIEMSVADLDALCKAWTAYQTCLLQIADERINAG